MKYMLVDTVVNGRLVLLHCRASNDSFDHKSSKKNLIKLERIMFISRKNNEQTHFLNALIKLYEYQFFIICIT